MQEPNHQPHQRQAPNPVSIAGVTKGYCGSRRRDYGTANKSATLLAGRGGTSSI